jgi:hypothetical protein
VRVSLPLLITMTALRNGGTSGLATVVARCRMIVHIPGKRRHVGAGGCGPELGFSWTRRVDDVTTKACTSEVVVA